MGEIKGDETTENGEVALDEQELDNAVGGGGPTHMKIPNLFSGGDGFVDPNASIKDLQGDKIRLPGGSIRANKVK